MPSRPPPKVWNLLSGKENPRGSSVPSRLWQSLRCPTLAGAGAKGVVPINWWDIFWWGVPSNRSHILWAQHLILQADHGVLGQFQACDGSRGLCKDPDQAGLVNHFRPWGPRPIFGPGKLFGAGLVTALWSSGLRGSGLFDKTPYLQHPSTTAWERVQMQRAAEGLGEAAGQKSGSRGPNPSLAVLSHLPALEETPVRAVPLPT